MNGLGRWMVPLLLILPVVLTGCAAVEPWQRGTLAEPDMALDPNPIQSALRAHTHSSRESAGGGDSAEGGGCGCT